MAPIILTEKDKARFLSKLKRDEATGCLEWTDYRDSFGYGAIRIGGRAGKFFKVHRVAFALAHGTPKPGVFVLHRCDNPSCCEPTHLWPGTLADNNADRDAKNRACRSRSGLPYGVRTSGKRYMAQVWVKGAMRTYGIYDSWAEASAIALFQRNLVRNP